jgi:hypothetical protein
VVERTTSFHDEHDSIRGPSLATVSTGCCTRHPERRKGVVAHARRAGVGSALWRGVKHLCYWIALTACTSSSPRDTPCTGCDGKGDGDGQPPPELKNLPGYVVGHCPLAGPAQTPDEVLAYYLAAQGSAPDVRAGIEASVGKSFGDWSEDDYAGFIATLDPCSVDDFMKWSSLVGLSTVGLFGTNANYYWNSMIAPFDVAQNWGYYDLSPLKTMVDAPNSATLTNSQTGQIWSRTFDEVVFTPYPYTDWSNYHVHFTSLKDQLVDLSAIPDHDIVFAADLRMPLNMVLMLRDAGNYLTSKAGRGFTIASPVSNSASHLAAGLLPGSYIEQRGQSTVELDLLAETSVHELCHTLDDIAIHKTSWTMTSYPWIYPVANGMKPQRLSLFQGHPSTLGQQPLYPGFISDYSQTNDQEDLAEHCAYFALQRDYFRQLAQQQAQAGNPLLQSKFDFMQQLFEDSTVVATPSLPTANNPAH